MFGRDEFREWLNEREEPVGAWIPDSMAGQCLSCGTALSAVPYTHENHCGFCLAYEFGEACAQDRVVEVLGGVARIAVAADDAPFKYVLRQLIDDAGEALRLAASTAGD